MEPDQDSKEAVPAVLNQTDLWFLLFLLQYEALHRRGKTQQQLSLEKERSSSTTLGAVPTEIPSCSDMSSIVRQNEHIN